MRREHGDLVVLKAEAIKLRQEGLTLREIGERLRMHINSVSRWVSHIPFDGFDDKAIADQERRFRDPHTHQRALELRRQGWSYKMITTELGVNKSTLSGWLRNEPRPDPVKGVAVVRSQLARVRSAATKSARHLSQISDLQLKAASEIQEMLGDNLSDRELFIAGLMLYWGEGSKTQDNITLANTDPQIIRLFVVWVERCLGVPRQQLGLRVYLYPDSDVEAAESYWAEVAGVSKDQFKKAQVDTRTDKVAKKHGTLKFGTVHVRVSGTGNTDLHRRIMGWLAGFGQYVKHVLDKQESS